jgi:hypothetical protein
VVEKQANSYSEAERNAQIKITLPDTIKPDILVMLLDHLDTGKPLPNTIDLYIAQNIVLISGFLKLR